MHIVLCPISTSLGSDEGLDYKTYLTLVEPGLVLELGPRAWLSVVYQMCGLLLFHRFLGRILFCLTCAPALVFEDHKGRVCMIEVRPIEQKTAKEEAYRSQ